MVGIKTTVGQRVFISFSHADDVAYREYYLAFTRLGCEPYTYQEYGRGIAPGADILHELEQKVSFCDLFIVLVTLQSVRSPWVLHECAFACENNVSQRFAVYLHSSRSHSATRQVVFDPPPHLVSLGVVANRLLSEKAFWTEGDESAEVSVARMLSELGWEVNWETVIGSTSHGYFISRCISELPLLPMKDDRTAVGDIRRAQEDFARVDDCLKRGDLNSALKLSRRVNAELRQRSCDGLGLYNGAMLELSLLFCVIGEDSLDSRRLLRERKKLQSMRKHQACDEYLYQSLGYICFLLGEYSRARLAFRKALAFDPRGEDAVYGYVMASFECHRNVARKWIELCLEVCKRDIQRTAVLIRTAIQNRDESSAYRLLRGALSSFDAGGRIVLVTTLVAEWADLSEIQLVKNAWLAAKMSCGRTVDRETIMCAEGLFFAQHGRYAEALSSFDAVCSEFGPKIDHVGRKVHMLILLGQPDSAVETWLNASEECRYEHTPAYFYYRGMIRWIRGLYSDADKDFRESDAPPEQYYQVACFP
jgi:tetratricopeptide (TPR) repeat protein